MAERRSLTREQVEALLAAIGATESRYQRSRWVAQHRNDPGLAPIIQVIDAPGRVTLTALRDAIRANYNVPENFGGESNRAYGPAVRSALEGLRDTMPQPQQQQQQQPSNPVTPQASSSIQVSDDRPMTPLADLTQPTPPSDEQGDIPPSPEIPDNVPPAIRDAELRIRHLMRLAYEMQDTITDEEAANIANEYYLQYNQLSFGAQIRVTEFREHLVRLHRMDRTDQAYMDTIYQLGMRPVTGSWNVNRAFREYMRATNFARPEATRHRDRIALTQAMARMDAGERNTFNEALPDFIQTHNIIQQIAEQGAQVADRIRYIIDAMAMAYEYEERPNDSRSSDDIREARKQAEEDIEKRISELTSEEATILMRVLSPVQGVMAGFYEDSYFMSFDRWQDAENSRDSIEEEKKEDVTMNDTVDDEDEVNSIAGELGGTNDIDLTATSPIPEPSPVLIQPPPVHPMDQLFRSTVANALRYTAQQIYDRDVDDIPATELDEISEMGILRRRLMAAIDSLNNDGELNENTPNRRIFERALEMTTTDGESITQLTQRLIDYELLAIRLEHESSRRNPDQRHNLHLLTVDAITGPSVNLDTPWLGDAMFHFESNMWIRTLRRMIYERLGSNYVQAMRQIARVPRDQRVTPLMLQMAGNHPVPQIEDSKEELPDIESQFDLPRFTTANVPPLPPDRYMGLGDDPHEFGTDRMMSRRHPKAMGGTDYYGRLPPGAYHVGMERGYYGWAEQDPRSIPHNVRGIDGFNERDTREINEAIRINIPEDEDPQRYIRRDAPAFVRDTIVDYGMDDDEEGTDREAWNRNVLDDAILDILDTEKWMESLVSLAIPDAEWEDAMPSMETGEIQGEAYQFNDNNELETVPTTVRMYEAQGVAPYGQQEIRRSNEEEDRRRWRQAWNQFNDEHFTFAENFRNDLARTALEPFQTADEYHEVGQLGRTAFPVTGILRADAEPDFFMSNVLLYQYYLRDVNDRRTAIARINHARQNEYNNRRERMVNEFGEETVQKWEEQTAAREIDDSLARARGEPIPTDRPPIPLRPRARLLDAPKILSFDEWQYINREDITTEEFDDIVYGRKNVDMTGEERGEFSHETERIDKEKAFYDYYRRQKLVELPSGKMISKSMLDIRREKNQLLEEAWRKFELWEQEWWDLRQKFAEKKAFALSKRFTRQNQNAQRIERLHNEYKDKLDEMPLARNNPEKMSQEQWQKLVEENPDYPDIDRKFTPIEEQELMDEIPRPPGTPPRHPLEYTPEDWEAMGWSSMNMTPPPDPRMSERYRMTEERSLTQRLADHERKRREEGYDENTRMGFYPREEITFNNEYMNHIEPMETALRNPFDRSAVIGRSDSPVTLYGERQLQAELRKVRRRNQRRRKLREKGYLDVSEDEEENEAEFRRTFNKTQAEILEMNRQRMLEQRANVIGMIQRSVMNNPMYTSDEDRRAALRRRYLQTYQMLQLNNPDVLAFVNENLERFGLDRPLPADPQDESTPPKRSREKTPENEDMQDDDETPSSPTKRGRRGSTPEIKDMEDDDDEGGDEEKSYEPDFDPFQSRTRRTIDSPSNDPVDSDVSQERMRGAIRQAQNRYQTPELRAITPGETPEQRSTRHANADSAIQSANREMKDADEMMQQQGGNQENPRDKEADDEVAGITDQAQGGGQNLGSEMSGEVTGSSGTDSSTPYGSMDSASRMAQSDRDRQYSVPPSPGPPPSVGPPEMTDRPPSNVQRPQPQSAAPTQAEGGGEAGPQTGPVATPAQPGQQQAVTNQNKAASNVESELDAQEQISKGGAGTKGEGHYTQGDKELEAKEPGIKEKPQHQPPPTFRGKNKHPSAVRERVAGRVLGSMGRELVGDTVTSNVGESENPGQIPSHTSIDVDMLSYKFRRTDDMREKDTPEIRLNNKRKRRDVAGSEDRGGPGTGGGMFKYKKPRKGMFMGEQDAENPEAPPQQQYDAVSHHAGPNGGPFAQPMYGRASRPTSGPQFPQSASGRAGVLKGMSKFGHQNVYAHDAKGGIGFGKRGGARQGIGGDGLVDALKHDSIYPMIHLKACHFYLRAQNYQNLAEIFEPGSQMKKIRQDVKEKYKNNPRIALQISQDVIKKFGRPLYITQLAYPNPSSLDQAIHEAEELRELETALSEYQKNTQGMYQHQSDLDTSLNQSIEAILNGQTLSVDAGGAKSFLKHTREGLSGRKANMPKYPFRNFSDRKKNFVPFSHLTVS